MKVEELERYGKTLTGVPREAMKKQVSIVFRRIRQKFGLLGVIPFLFKVLLEKRAVIKKHPDAYRAALDVGDVAAAEISMLVAMFNVIARREGRDKAYDFVQGIFQEVAIYSMPALYQVDDLVRCEGDVFENFLKFNAALFEATTAAGSFRVKSIETLADKQTIIVEECANCTVGEAFGCPEIAQLGCDHDLAGYPVILDQVNAEFRRPHTLAKGDDYCDFQFYRKGTAPDTAHLNK